jgi:hypothetical protein
MIIALVGISITSYYFYAPYVYPSLWRQIGQPMAHVIEYGGTLLFLTVFTFIWPVTGGISATLYGTVQILIFASGRPYPLVPTPANVPLYVLFIAGGILYMIWGLPRQRLYAGHSFLKRTRWAARIAAILPIVLTIFIYWLIYPSPFLLGTIPGLITAGIAWFWPAPGGFLMLLPTVPGFYALFESNYDFTMKLPAYILCGIFIASGFLHIIIAWREKRLRAG